MAFPSGGVLVGFLFRSKKKEMLHSLLEALSGEREQSALAEFVKADKMEALRAGLFFFPFGLPLGAFEFWVSWLAVDGF